MSELDLSKILPKIGIGDSQKTGFGIGMNGNVHFRNQRKTISYKMLFRRAIEYRIKLLMPLAKRYSAPFPRDTPFSPGRGIRVGTVGNSYLEENAGNGCSKFGIARGV